VKNCAKNERNNTNYLPKEKKVEGKDSIPLVRFCAIAKKFIYHICYKMEVTPPTFLLETGKFTTNSILIQFLKKPQIFSVMLLHYLIRNLPIHPSIRLPTSLV